MKRIRLKHRTALPFIQNFQFNLIITINIFEHFNQ